MTRQAAAYLRNSKDPGTKAEHLARLMAAVHADGSNGNATLYDDWNRSGDRAKLGKRTGWTALCQAIEADQIEVVFMNDLDRGGRSQEEWLRFRRVAAEHKVRVVAGGIDWSAPSRRLEFSIKTMVAEEELEADRRRSAATHRMQVAREDAMGQPGYGYRFAKHAKGERVVLEPNPDEPLEPVLAVVRETRGNISAACKLLTARGVPTRSGEAWHSRTLKRIVIRVGEGRLLRLHRQS
jgi:DNA invertase Pin-like site-specific DNA recombinase